MNKKLFIIAMGTILLNPISLYASEYPPQCVNPTTGELKPNADQHPECAEIIKEFQRPDQATEDQEEVSADADTTAGEPAVEEGGVPEVTVDVPEIEVDVPDVPEIKVDVPEIKVDVPEIKVDVPEIKVDVPEIKVDVPEIKVDVPEIKVDVPEIKVDVPEIKVDVPEIKVDVPEIKVDVPEIKVDVPEIKVDVPEIKVDVPEIKVDVPEIKVDVPEIKVDVPEIKVDVPEVNIDIPAVKIDVPEMEIVIDLPDLGVTATTADGDTLTTSAKAKGGVAVAGEVTNTVSLADPVDVNGNLAVDPKQVAQLTDIVVYAAYQPLDGSLEKPLYYMLGTDGGIQAWDENPATLVPFITVANTVAVTTDGTTQLQVPMYKGYFLLPGKLNIYFGYRLTDGTVVTNEQAMDVTITMD